MTSPVEVRRAEKDLRRQEREAAKAQEAAKTEDPPTAADLGCGCGG